MRSLSSSRLIIADRTDQGDAGQIVIRLEVLEADSPDTSKYSKTCENGGQGEERPHLTDEPLESTHGE